ncbi:MAG: [FeFe] hydrogenase H-cluster radical SAM maturase HydE [Prevotella sp.]|uniref:[FeFe] hydrogenase H-cluster radical SAM maturase HydE n=1 Tax=Prevotella sp. TaxID=59823 RepID=UPI002A255A94|nr:[FeFe] hydrogenase H-cluster radical SAM maturase HydE [Prevotella sp.]MDD7319003.1 [FeFe] hydrogenase H-cluster radical SAM maturase HydE [Prevotellaceae bacterium]MDY4020783.1 [FeFe] hydrogenase H-cluster radical SAM maturase HydE [Prevotella sp.]
MKDLVDRLNSRRTLTAGEYKQLLLCRDAEVTNYLHRQAQEETLARFGNKIFIRGLIEFTNRCRNDCYYCGIRKSNRRVTRYELTGEEVLACCDEGYRLGFRTFVLQGGEMPDVKDEWLETIVACIRRRYPDCAITLSLGEKSRETYERLFRAGADRYLLRHETYNAQHYRKLHPAGMSLVHRLQCLDWLKEIGYQVGTGIMVGSPYQTIDHVVEDILFIERFRPKMIGLGPFIPHHDTPLAAFSPGDVDLCLRLISIFRLMLPATLIPATTALATLVPDGRERGILVGANVVMPNLSPQKRRADYSLYDNKAFAGAEAAEGLRELKERLNKIGYELSGTRGDYESRS